MWDSDRDLDTCVAETKELLEERGYDAMMSQCRVTEVLSVISGAQAVIATSQVPYDIDVPVVDGIPFLTGIGRKEVVDQIEEILKNTDKNHSFLIKERVD